MDEAAEKENILTENELKLKTESQTKEWEEVDKQQINSSMTTTTHIEDSQLSKITLTLQSLNLVFSNYLK